MPYLQPYIDPNTGATYPQSYVRSSPPTVDFAHQNVSFTAMRYASQTCYSLGYKPLQSLDVQIHGVAYGSWFGPQIAAAEASLMGLVGVSADAFIGSTLTLSGAQVAT